MSNYHCKDCTFRNCQTGCRKMQKVIYNLEAQHRIDGQAMLDQAKKNEKLQDELKKLNLILFHRENGLAHPDLQGEIDKSKFSELQDRIADLETADLIEKVELHQDLKAALARQKTCPCCGYSGKNPVHTCNRNKCKTVQKLQDEVETLRKRFREAVAVECLKCGYKFKVLRLEPF